MMEQARLDFKEPAPAAAPPRPPPGPGEELRAAVAQRLARFAEPEPAAGRSTAAERRAAAFRAVARARSARAAWPAPPAPPAPGA